MSASTIGTANAAVLPLPVVAMATTSAPRIACGRQCRCTGVGTVIPSDASEVTSAGRTPNSAKPSPIAPPSAAAASPGRRRPRRSPLPSGAARAAAGPGPAGAARCSSWRSSARSSSPSSSFLLLLFLCLASVERFEKTSINPLTRSLRVTLE